jgi:phage gp36-like protein
VSYAAQQDCIDRFGEDAVIVATDRDNNGAIDTAVLTKALADADTTIDSYIAGLPGYPFSPVPDICEKLACDLAMYFSARGADVATDESRQRYDDAITYLKLVGSQKIRLSADTGQEIVESNSTADITSQERELDRTTLNRLF